MAQTGYTPILLYSSSTTTNAPAAGNLTNSTFGSELAINIADGKLFYKDPSNNVQVIAWKTTPTTAGGTGLTTYAAGDLTYYASGTTLNKLAIGSAGQILTSTGTAPEWTTLSGVAVTTFSAGTTGFTPNSATSGAVTLAGTLITSNGGTGLSLYSQGDLLYYNTGTTLTALAKNTTATRYLSNTGTNNNPAWAQINLANGVTGTLPTGNGGTGLTSFTANGIVYASSTSALTTNSDLVYNATDLTLSSGNVVVNSIGANDRGINGTAGGSFRFAITRQDAIQAASLYINAFGGIGFSSGLSSGGTPGSAPKMFLFNSGGFSIGNTTDPGAGNLNVNGSTLKVGTTSLYGSNSNIGTFSWSSATGNGGEGGYVFVNTSTSSNSDANPVLLLHKGSTTTSSSARFIQFFADGATQPMGGIVGNGATNVQFVSLSDERDKENIQPVTGALDRLMQIQVCSFDRKGSGDHVNAGFIAQNVLPVYPEYVVENAANLDEEPRYGITGGMSAGYVAELTAATQEQQAMIDQLKQQVAQLLGNN